MCTLVSDYVVITYTIVIMSIIVIMYSLFISAFGIIMAASYSSHVR